MKNLLENMDLPKVAIIILNWNGVDDTIKCINSLEKITYSSYEIIVIDNNSDGDDVEILKKTFGEQIRIIENDENYGYAEGNNIGIKYALEKGIKWLLILNNDIIVDPAFLIEMVTIINSNPNIGIVGPKTYYMDRPNIIFTAGGKVNKYFGQHWMRGHGKDDKSQFDKTLDVDFVAGACMLFTKEVINRAGLIPTEYFLQWEDIDYCTQIRKNGYRCVYVPKAKIWHKVGASFVRGKQNYPMIARGIRNRFIYNKKYMSNSQFFCFIICFSLITAPIYVLFYILYYHDLTRVRSFLSGYLNGLKNSTND